MKKSFSQVYAAIMTASILTLLLSTWSGRVNAADISWANPQLLVTPAEIKKNISKKDWVVVDCRSLGDYLKGHIKGAISLGNRCKKALRDPTSRVFRDISKYEKLLAKVGISNNTHVVFYYGGVKTITDATVGFWILEYLGHKKVHVLNGGLTEWRKSGNRLDNTPVRKPPGKYKAEVVASRYATTGEILKIAKGEADASQLIDSRTKKEYIGKDIRAIRGGHVPNVKINVSHLDTLKQKKDLKTGNMIASPYIDPDQAQRSFASLDKNKRTIAYCQTGTRSTLTYLQLRLLGYKDPANWDESWTVYGSQLAYPVEGEQWFNFAKMNKQMKKMLKKLSKLEKQSKITQSKAEK